MKFACRIICLALLGFVPVRLFADEPTALQSPVPGSYFSEPDDAPPQQGSIGSLPILEIAPGFGYAFGGGAEDPAPDLPSVTFAVTFWYSRSFGVNVSAVRGVGQDLYDQSLITPSVGDVYAREYFGKERLRYNRVMIRYRRSLTERMDMNLGVGLVLHGSFRDIVTMHTPDGPVDVSAQTDFGGLAAEFLLGRRIAPHFVMKSGVAFDFNVETTMMLPTVQMVIDF